MTQAPIDHTTTMVRSRTTPCQWRRAAAAILVAAALASGCSSGGSNASVASSTTAGATSPAQPVGWKPPVCKRAVASTPKVTAVAGKANDRDLISFDGTRIRIHWFPRAAKGAATSPTVLMGPGWGLGGETNASASAPEGVQNVLTIARLHKAGYNVMTWDPRGFGASDGTVEVDSAAFEAEDVSRIIDWIATRPGVQLDSKGDPRLGMVGESYGGGIQFVTAATDCRVDAITPTIAWNSLATSLYPAETVKAGWTGILISVAAKAELDAHVLSANRSATSSGVLSQDDRQWFVDRGPDNLLTRIHVPTLIVQGTPDNLFPLAEGARNFVALQANGTPVAMTWFCGGHGVCLNRPDPKNYVAGTVLNWLRRYVRRDAAAPGVPVFETTDQNGRVHTYDSFPPSGGEPPVFAFADSGKLQLQPNGGSGPLATAPAGDVIGSLAKAITPAKASKALDVPITVSGKSRMLLGAPDLTLGYTCTLDAPATRPTRIFAQLVDDATSRVLGNQVTPIAITCDGLLHQARTPLEMVAHAVRPGARLTLQLTATSVAYATPQMGGTVDFARIVLNVPTVGNGTVGG